MKQLLFIIQFVFIQLTLCAQPSTVFFRGEGGYACFRIPSVIRTPKSLLAFAEGRRHGCSDTGDIDIVMKSSKDGGKTWSKLSVVWDAGDGVCGNPVPIYDSRRRQVVLVCCWNYGKDTESQLMSGSSRHPRRVYVLTATPDGRRWSVPREITDSVKLPSWGWYATGPCHGIQLKQTHRGRLVVPANHSSLADKTYYSHLIYSDDGGKTWHLGGLVKEKGGNESSVAELPDGRLMLNMRNYNSQHPHVRAYALSRDGGRTMGQMQFHDDLLEPVCQGSLLAFDKHTLLFSNPHSLQRKNLAIHKSVDGGRHWQLMQTVYPGHAAYSDIVKLDRGHVGVLFEHGINDAYEQISFVSIPVK